MNIKDFAKIEYKEAEGGVIALVDGEDIFDVFEDKEGAEDAVADFLNDELKRGYKYYCGYCQEYFQEEEVEHRIEDDRFTAPFGSTIVMGGDISTIPVCPTCGLDMEEC